MKKFKHLSLEEARTIDEVKDIRDKAEAFRLYVKQQKESLEVQNKVAEIKLRCERKIGVMLEDREKPISNQFAQSQTATLQDLDITKSDSSRWQTIANLPEDKFEKYIAQVKDNNEELTTIGLVRLAKSLDKQEEIQNLDNIWNIILLDSWKLCVKSSNVVDESLQGHIFSIQLHH